MDYVKQYQEAKAREARAAENAAEQAARGQREAAAQRQALASLVAERHCETHPSRLTTLGTDRKRVTDTARALYFHLCANFDSAATDRELAARLGVRESDVIGALAELDLHGFVTALEGERGERRLRPTVVI